MSQDARCSVCGSPELVMHLRVASALDEQGLIPSTNRFGAALGDIVRCPRCGHMQLQPMPRASWLAAAYADAASEDYVEEEAGQRETARRALHQIEAHAPARGALLDLGCWVGFLLAEARERGWHSVGVEPSAFAAEYARERLGLDVRTEELFTAVLPAHGFDVVVMGDVIEHLEDPAAALVRVKKLLRPRGLLWMTLPDAGSRVARALGRRWWSVIPTHVQYFTRSSMRALLERSGFEALAIQTAPKAFTVGYYLARVSGYSPRLGRLLVGAGTALGVRDRTWAPDFRDRMAVLARSTGA